MKKRVLSWMLALALCLGLTAPALALEAEEYQTLASGQYASFYIKEDGSLWGWGENDRGAVGNGTSEPCPTPVKILDDVVSVETYGAYTLAIKRDSSMWAWGDISFDQVYLSPTKVMDDVSSAWASRNMWIILKTDGSLYTWGVLWRIGETHRILIGSSSPEKVLDNVVSVALVENTIAAVAADGSVWTWGNNAYGRLGDGSSEDTYRLDPVKMMDGVASVSGGNPGVFLALKKDGTLWSWGGHEFYNLRGDGQPAGTPGYTPAKIMEDVTYVETEGWEYSAIKRDGSVWLWGKFVQLDGRGSEERLTPVKDLDGNTVKLYAGFGPVFAIKDDGSLWSWGDNDSVRLGQGVQGPFTGTPVPACILDHIQDVAVGSFRVLALGTDGTLWGWGSAQYFAPELTSPGNRSVYVSTPMVLADGVSAIYSNSNSTAGEIMLLKEDGSLWAYLVNDPKSTDYYYTLTKIADGVRKPGEGPALTSAPAAPAGDTAEGRLQSLSLSGSTTQLYAYNIGGNNYFKLRDLAALLAGSEAEFSVGYDSASKAVTLQRGGQYIPAGGEGAVKEPETIQVQPSQAALYVNGEKQEVTAYNIGGNNYFKLRDLGRLMNFGVGYDSATKLVVLDPTAGYSE